MAQVGKQELPAADRLGVRVGLSQLDEQRGRLLAQLAFKGCLVDVDAHAGDDKAKPVHVRRQFAQDAHALFPVQNHVVGPFDAGVQTGAGLRDGPGGSQRRGQRKQLRLLRRQRGPKHQRLRQRHARGGFPPALKPPAPGGLLVAQGQAAGRRARSRQLLGADVGGIHLRLVGDLAPPGPAGIQLMQEVAGQQAVFLRVQPVAQLARRDDAVSFRAQLFHALPHGGARHAHLLA